MRYEYGYSADALKAIAVEVNAVRAEIPGLELVALVHDEVICVVPEERADEAAERIGAVMKEVASEVVNGDSPPKERVPIEADTKICTSWADK
jgi:DNA polymerase I-like protein with 3'-5' exonuclease and polymerase domains